MNADDVGVRDLAREQQLALEAAEDGSRRLVVQRSVKADHLDGHRDFEDVIPGLVDRAHAADAEQADDVVARAEVLTDVQRGGTP